MHLLRTNPFASSFLSAVCGLAFTFAASAPAQDLSLRLVSGGCDVSLSTGYNQLIAANTDVSNGYAIEASNGRGSRARSELVVQRGAGAMTVRLTETTSYYSASSGLPFLTNRLTMALQAPRAARLRLQIGCVWTYDNQPFVFGSGAFVGAGLEVRTGLVSGQLSRTQDIDLPANAPVSFQFGDLLGLQSQPASIDWTVRITAIDDHACAPTPYGTNCGLALAVGADLSRTGSQFAELRLRGAPVPGLLIVGLQRTAIPVGPCVLRNEALVVLQVGAARTYFDPPQLPGWSFLLQGAALDGSALVASEGLQLACR